MARAAAARAAAARAVSTVAAALATATRGSVEQRAAPAATAETLGGLAVASSPSEALAAAAPVE